LEQRTNLYQEEEVQKKMEYFRDNPSWAFQRKTCLRFVGFVFLAALQSRCY